MKPQRIIPIAILALVLIAAGGAAFYFLSNPAAWQTTLTQLELAEPSASGLTASGFIEAEEVDIAPQIGGRLGELLVEEGDDIEADTLLIRLDGTLLDAQIASARAGVDTAQARLAQVKAGVRPEQIRQAEAGLARAEAARDGAYAAWQDARAIRDNPQELDARIAAARFAVRSAEAELAASAATKDAAVIAYENYGDAKDKFGRIKEKLAEEYEDAPEDERPDLPNDIPAQLGFHMIPYDYWKAWVGFNTAEAKLQQATTSLNDLLTMRDNPQDLDAQVEGAKAEYEAARAAVDRAESQLQALRSGATAEEIAVAQAQVEQAQASLNRLLSERDKLTIHAPVGGLVLEVTIRAGELAAPGATLLTLGDLDEVTLTVYVPEDQLGKVNVGQKAEVEVDSFPRQVFEGRVVAIANEAEFTPRNVQTKEERVNMVFAVDITIPNPDHKLKPGVPADATIVTEEG
jgi:multidrug efflux pump subunit AcrA (membrane-fusion protein)